MTLGHCDLHGVARDRMYGVVGCSVCEFNSALGLEPPRKTIRLAPNAPLDQVAMSPVIQAARSAGA